MYNKAMNNRQFVFEATKIIETHLTKTMSVKDLSDKIGYSLFHFIRLFHGVVGCTPGEYISSRRLSRAAQDLISQNKKVIDIALDYQFSSPEAFSRAFKKHSGFSPSKFRKSGNAIKDLSRLTWITPYYTNHNSIDPAEESREPEEISLAVCRTLPLSKKKNFQNSISRIKFLHECKFYKY